MRRRRVDDAFWFTVMVLSLAWLPIYVLWRIHAGH